MERLKVKTSDLIKVLKANRKKHIIEYKEAVRQYRLRAVEALKRELDKAINGKSFTTNISMTRPTSHEKDYDLIIKMLEMSVEEITILDHHEFNQFVMDEWSWKPNFRASTTYYGMSGTSGFSGSSGTSGASGTSGTSGISYKSEDIEDESEEFITVTFSGDELYEPEFLSSATTENLGKSGSSGFSGT